MKGPSFKGAARPVNNHYEKIELIAYCLMPNHFHLLIKQVGKGAMQSFMRSLATRYSGYFNKKYSRVGPLFQGIYKAVIILDEKYLLHLSRYIHLNPLEYVKNISDAYSSYAEYLQIRKTPWIKPEIVLSCFSKTSLYESFVVSFLENKDKDRQLLENITLED